jgi:glycosyltransferase involved in cell wall biosynthesis
MMGDSTISVVIPTLNEERNLETCFGSLMKQIHDDFEVIIVDGGSKDQTVDMAEKYGFRILEVQKRRPHDVSAAKNEGASRASGDILLFLDADMTVEPNCLAVLADGYRAPVVVGIACKVLPFDGNGVERAMYQLNNILARFSNWVGIHELSYFSCHSYRKDCFVKVGGFREDLHACEDLDLALRLRRLGRYLVTPATTLWASPRRLREWSYPGYLRRYVKFLVQYYLDGQIGDYYDDL